MKQGLIIFGENGMLASAMINFFRSEGLSDQYDVRIVNRAQFDASSLDFAKLKEIEKSWPRNCVVINCIGVIPQRKVQDDAIFIRVNGMFPHLLQLLCLQEAHRLIHITTDCVFHGVDDTPSGPHRSSDYPTERGIYGASKSIGEPANATVIRTSIIGIERSEPKVSLLEWVRQSPKRGEKEIKGYANHQWNGVTCHQLAKFVDFIITRGLFWKGVRNYVTKPSVTKFELVQHIAKIFDVDVTVIPHNTEIPNDKRLAAEGFEAPDICSQLQELKEF